MPYGNDEYFEKYAEKMRAIRLAQELEAEKALRQCLKEKFQVPDEFMDLAVKIWWDGKED